jgi:hypothetical protein
MIKPGDMMLGGLCIGINELQDCATVLRNNHIRVFYREDKNWYSWVTVSLAHGVNGLFIDDGTDITKYVDDSLVVPGAAFNMDAQDWNSIVRIKVRARSHVTRGG